METLPNGPEEQDQLLLLRYQILRMQLVNPNPLYNFPSADDEVEKDPVQEASRQLDILKAELAERGIVVDDSDIL